MKELLKTFIANIKYNNNNNNNNVSQNQIKECKLMLVFNFLTLNTV